MCHPRNCPAIAPAPRGTRVAALKAFAAENAYVVEANQGGNQTLAGAAARQGVLSLGTEAVGPATSPPPGCAWWSGG